MKKKKTKENVIENQYKKQKPVGYRMHPNPELGALWKVKWEKIENFPQKRRFSPKIDGLL